MIYKFKDDEYPNTGWQKGIAVDDRVTTNFQRKVLIDSISVPEEVYIAIYDNNSLRTNILITREDWQKIIADQARQEIANLLGLQP